MNSKSTVNSYPDVFRNGGYLHPFGSGINVVEEDEAEQEVSNYVTHGVRVQNWVTIDVPSCIQVSKYFVLLISFLLKKSFHSAQGGSINVARLICLV